MRVERPAASTTAAIATCSVGAGSSRGCGRVTISISSPPTPMPVILRAAPASPASSRISTQSKPFSLGERAQPGAPSTGAPARRADQQQIAGIDRHAEMLDLAACRFDRRRNDVAAVGDRRGAEHDHQLGAALAAPRRCALGERVLLVRHAPLGDDAGAGRRQPLARSPSASCRSPCRRAPAAASR